MINWLDSHSCGTHQGRPAAHAKYTELHTKTIMSRLLTMPHGIFNHNYNPRKKISKSEKHSAFSISNPAWLIAMQVNIYTTRAGFPLNPCSMLCYVVNLHSRGCYMYRDLFQLDKLERATQVWRPHGPLHSAQHSSHFITPQLPVDGLMQERRNSSALAMELRLTCINPSQCGGQIVKRNSTNT